MGPTSLFEVSNGHARQELVPYSAVPGDDSEDSWESASSITEEIRQNASSGIRRSFQRRTRSSDRGSLQRENLVEEPCYSARRYAHGTVVEPSGFLGDRLLPVRRRSRDQNDLAGNQEDPELEAPQPSQVSRSEQEDSHALEEEWEDVEEEIAEALVDTENEDTSSIDTELRELIEEFHRDNGRRLDPESRFEETVTVNGEKICADVVKYTGDGEPYLPGSPLGSTTGESSASSFYEEGDSDPGIDLSTLRRLIDWEFIDSESDSESSQEFPGSEYADD